MRWMRFSNLSITTKFVVAMMGTAVIAQLLMCGAIALYEVMAVRRAGVADAGTTARVLSERLTPTLNYYDKEAAHDVLLSLRGNPEVASAAVFSADGKLFAQYMRNDVAANGTVPDQLVRLGSDQNIFHGGTLEVYRPIFVSGELLGVVYLRSNLWRYHAQIRKFGIAILGVTCGTSIVVLFVAIWLQRFITRPILGLTHLAQTVAANDDYSIRAMRQGDDEIGLLAEAFNKALQQVERRDGALRSANEALQSELSERKRLEAERDRLLVREQALRAEAEAARDQLRSLSRRVVEAQESERRYLAHELHDEIGQSLTALSCRIDMCAGQPAHEVQKSLHNMQKIIQEMIGLTRRLSLDLRPSILDHFGLLATFRWYFERFTEQTRVQVGFAHRGIEERRFSPEIEIAVYRTMQEALTNVARHARVDSVSVRLMVDESALRLEIEDKGGGFHGVRANTPAKTGGLVGMTERIEWVGGTVRIDSSPGAGTRIVAEVPL